MAVAARALLSELMAALAQTDPLALPDEVARIRKQAMKPGSGDRHPGRRLTLYWENPARLPDPPVGVWS